MPGSPPGRQLKSSHPRLIAFFFLVSYPNILLISGYGVAATLLLGEDVERAEEGLVGLDGAGHGDDHATPDILTADTTDKKARVVTGTGLLTGLLEGLNVGDLGLDDLLTLANDLNLGILPQNTTLDTATDDGATAGDGEDILDGHEERLLEVTLRGGDPLINSLHQLIDLVGTNLGLLVVHGHEGGTHDDGRVVTLESVGGKELTHLHLDKFKHLRASVRRKQRRQ
ncbi:hypothetical protein HYQ46_009866 [Verticillium longisporum]|nr:hypothetical protein HYQ46_009866 [Verticillium longisporum]